MPLPGSQKRCHGQGAAPLCSTSCMQHRSWSALPSSSKCRACNRVAGELRASGPSPRPHFRIPGLAHEIPGARQDIFLVWRATVPTLLKLDVHSVGSKRHMGGRTTGTSPSSSVSSATTLPRRWCNVPLPRQGQLRTLTACVADAFGIPVHAAVARTS
jgi:hypothetical protein